MDFGIASVAAITVICYLIGLVVKASGLDNKHIPAIVGVCGGVLGLERTRKRRAAGLRTYMLVCIGVAAAVTFQTFINIGMNIGITPVIGITLPFFSYGGSSMVTMFGAMGLVSGVKYKLKPEHFSLVY